MPDVKPPEEFIAYLKEKWKDAACPMCGVATWQVTDGVFQLTRFTGGTFVVGGQVVPVIPVVCGNCGNTVLVNALLSGMVKGPASPSEQPASSNPKPSGGGTP